ncbi:MAG TPA: histidine kinase [Verrucomicrobiae bacterium]|nr:histidine kinase [Verrucomicrobiae bacterium]
MTNSQNPGSPVRASRALLRRATSMFGLGIPREPEPVIESLPPVVEQSQETEQQLAALVAHNAELEQRLAAESAHLSEALAEIQSLQSALQQRHPPEQDLLERHRSLELQRTNQELAAEVQERKRVVIALSAFSHLGQKLHSAHSETEAAKIIAETAQTLIPHHACSIALYGADDQLHPIIQAVASPDARLFRSNLSVPIRNGLRVVGILEIKSAVPDAFSIADANTLQSLGDYCGGALERVRAEKALRHLSRSILDAQENERRRVARELHDGVNQAIASIKFRIQTAEQQIARGDPKWQETCAKTKEMLDSVLQQVRRLSQNLRPGELDDFGLVAATRSACQEFEARTGIDVTFVAEGLELRLPPPLELSLYRISQEALTNIERHSGADSVQISLAADQANVILRISDNGRGIIPGERHEKGGGLGLLHMRERAGLAGGTFTLESGPGQGVRLKVEAPIHAIVPHPS